MVNTYLFLAFALVWLIFFLYIWSLSRQQARLREELEALKAQVQSRRPSGPESR